jgi:hypothetical protein
MAVFVFKIISIAIKTLARPLINWLAYYNRISLQESKKPVARFIKKFFEGLGQNVNYYNILLNRKIFGITKETSQIKSLTSEKALEKGAETVSEIVVYTILLTLPIYEMMKSYKTNKQKEKKKKDEIVNLQNDIDELIEINCERKIIIAQIKEKLNNYNIGSSSSSFISNNKYI